MGLRFRSLDFSLTGSIRFMLQTRYRAKPKCGWRKWAQKHIILKHLTAMKDIIITQLHWSLCISSSSSSSTGRQRLGLIYSLWTSPACRNRWQIDHAALIYGQTSHVFYSFWRPSKDQITEETERATGGSNIGERKWTEWAKTEEAHGSFSVKGLTA